MKAVNECLSLIVEDWLEDSREKTFDLITEDVVFTKQIFCTCLDRHDIQYQLLENKLIVGNKKIYIYDEAKMFHG